MTRQKYQETRKSTETPLPQPGTHTQGTTYPWDANLPCVWNVVKHLCVSVCVWMGGCVGAGRSERPEQRHTQIFTERGKGRDRERERESEEAGEERERGRGVRVTQ